MKRRYIQLIALVTAFLLAIVFMIQGVQDVYSGYTAPVSAGLGAYATFIGGLIEIGIALLLISVGIFIMRRFQKLQRENRKD